jgi:hypothetical protein
MMRLAWQLVQTWVDTSTPSHRASRDALADWMVHGVEIAVAGLTTGNIVIEAFAFCNRSTKPGAPRI